MVKDIAFTNSNLGYALFFLYLAIFQCSFEVVRVVMSVGFFRSSAIFKSLPKQCLLSLLNILKIFSYAHQIHIQ